MLIVEGLARTAVCNGLCFSFCNGGFSCLTGSDWRVPHGASGQFHHDSPGTSVAAQVTWFS